MWNLEKWYRWSYVQSRNRDTEAQIKHMDTPRGKEGGGMDWEAVMDTINVRCPVLAESLPSCPTLRNPVNRSPSGPSVHGVLQARVLEWGATPSSRGPSPPRDQTRSNPALQADFSPSEPAEKPYTVDTMYKIELMRAYGTAQGTQLSAPWWPKREGDPWETGYMHV